MPKTPISRRASPGCRPRPPVTPIPPPCFRHSAAAGGTATTSRRRPSPRASSRLRPFSFRENALLVYLFVGRAAPNSEGRYGRLGSAAARFDQGAFRLGGGGHVHHRLRRVLRVCQPAVS